MKSILKVAFGFLVVFVLLGSCIPLLILLTPWRTARIKLTNHYGTLLGWSVVKISGVDLTVSGREKVSADRPAIYVGNHTSMLDAFTSIWLSPAGTVGVAKKEILYYPVYGQGWYLSGHLTIDRSNREAAVRSMKETGDLVREHGLHIFLWPEGTRARDGRLLPFKKGFVHLALQTGLPIIPFVTTNGHLAIEKASLEVRSVPMTIRWLDPIDTSAWTLDTLDQHVADVRQVFLDALPPEQRPSAPT